MKDLEITKKKNIENQLVKSGIFRGLGMVHEKKGNFKEALAYWNLKKYL